MRRDKLEENKARQGDMKLTVITVAAGKSDIITTVGYTHCRDDYFNTSGTSCLALVSASNYVPWIVPKAPER